MASFHPELQNFTILGSDGTTQIVVSMLSVDLLRVRLANLCISWGVQLGLCLMMLLTMLLLVPLRKLRQGVHGVNLISLIVAVVRLTLLIQYFPSPLAESYLVWTKDRSVLSKDTAVMFNTGVIFYALQFAFIEASLIMQCWGLIRSFPRFWKWLTRVKIFALAPTTIVLKCIWSVHFIQSLQTPAAPTGMDVIGRVATVMGAALIFDFCSILTVNLILHLIATRHILRRSDQCLTTLDILAIGNGLLMILTCMFAALDLSSGLSQAHVLPFDAGSWVMTLVVVGLPLTSITATYRGPTSSSGACSLRCEIFDSAPLNAPSPKRRASRTDSGNTEFSPVGAGGSSVVSADVARANSTRSYRNGRLSYPYSRQSFGEEFPGDLEWGYQATPRDMPGSGGGLGDAMNILPQIPKRSHFP